MGEDGFEPSKQEATDLQSAPFGHSGTLPYSLSERIGAGGRTRTPDLLITNQLLYQLSYTSNFLLLLCRLHLLPDDSIYYSTSQSICQAFFSKKFNFFKIVGISQISTEVFVQSFDLVMMFKPLTFPEKKSIIVIIS